MKRTLCLSLVGILFLGGFANALAAPSLVSFEKNDAVMSRAGSLRIGTEARKKNSGFLNSKVKVKSLGGTNTTSDEATVSRAATTQRFGVGRYLGAHAQSVSMGEIPNQLRDQVNNLEEQVNDLQVNKQNKLQLEQSEYLLFRDEDETVLDIDDTALLSALRDGHDIVLSYDTTDGITWRYEDDTEARGTISQQDLRDGILGASFDQDFANKMDKLDSGSNGEFVMATGNGGISASGYTFEELVNAVVDEIDRRNQN